MRPTSRHEQHLEKIKNFLDNQSRNTLTLRLYGRELPRLEREFPEITIEQGEHYNNTELIFCTIRRKS